MNRFSFHDDLLRRDRTLRGGIIFGIDGQLIEVQARATSVRKIPEHVVNCCRITGMARGSDVEVNLHYTAVE